MNKKKNVLILSPFFYPEPISTGKFNTDVALALSKKGHQVTVLCFHPFYPDWKIKKSEDELEGLLIVRGGKNLKFSNETIFRRLSLEFGYAFFVLRKLRKHQKESDIIIPVFPPSFAFFASLFFMKKRIKKIGMIHDLQEIYSIHKKGVVNKIISFFINKIESKCYNSCDKIIFLSNEMKDTAASLYKLNPEKLRIQYPFHSIKNEITDNLNDVIDKEKINIVYSGALGEKQNPQELYRFFNFASNKIKNVEFHFFSQGDIFNELKRNNKNTKIKFHNLVSRESLEELYSKSDVQIVPQLKNTSKGSLPSKLPNLLAAGCKTLVITDKGSEIEKLFETENLETVINSWDHLDILNALNNILEENTGRDSQIKLAKEKFTINKMIQEILN